MNPYLIFLIGLLMGLVIGVVIGIKFITRNTKIILRAREEIWDEMRGKNERTKYNIRKTKKNLQDFYSRKKKSEM